MNHVRPFLTRAGWVGAVLGLCALTFVVNVAAGAWVEALYVATLALLLTYGEAQHQRADDAEAQTQRLVSERLLYYTRRPRPEWEDVS